MIELQESQLVVLLDAATRANVKFLRVPGGWHLIANFNTRDSYVLCLKRGGPRVFRSLDTLVSWLQDRGSIDDLETSFQRAEVQRELI